MISYIIFKVERNIVTLPTSCEQSIPRMYLSGRLSECFVDMDSFGKSTTRTYLMWLTLYRTRYQWRVKCMGIGSYTRSAFSTASQIQGKQFVLYWECWTPMALKRKCRHFDKILITGCTGSCHFDNFQCSQWWKFHQNEDIPFQWVWT